MHSVIIIIFIKCTQKISPDRSFCLKISTLLSDFSFNESINSHSDLNITCKTWGRVLVCVYRRCKPPTSSLWTALTRAGIMFFPPCASGAGRCEVTSFGLMVACPHRCPNESRVEPRGAAAAGWAGIKQTQFDIDNAADVAVLCCCCLVKRMSYFVLIMS